MVQTFWETQPLLGGNPQVWETIRIAVDALLNNDLDLCSTVIEVRLLLDAVLPWALVLPRCIYDVM